MTRFETAILAGAIAVVFTICVVAMARLSHNKRASEQSGSLKPDERLSLAREKGARSLRRQYRWWSRKRRVHYWTLMFWRWGRWAGEDGFNEDVIFDDALANHLRLVDPNIERILPLIILRLAEMWGRDAEAMAQNFSKGTGISVKLSVAPKTGLRVRP